MNEDLCFSTVEELAPQIASGRLSSVELTQAYLDRCQALDGKLNAIITLTPEHALREARSADQETRNGTLRGPLHGIPYGLKDILDTQGIRTTGGSKIFAERIPDRDATVAVRLRNAGGVLLAKLGSGEFANGARHLKGSVHNPWKLDRTSSGSSCGPGAGTAAGFVGFSIGTETGGSLVGPSGSCGVSGMRPTYGRVSRYGCMPLSWSLDKIGPLARSAVDVGYVLEAIAGPDPKDPTAGRENFRFRADPGSVRGRKLGVYRASFESAPPANQAVFARALDVLAQAGFVFEDVAIPERPYGEVYATVSNAEGGTVWRPIIDDGRVIQMINHQRRADWKSGTMMPASDYIEALRLRHFIMHEMDELLSRYFAIVTPTSPRGAGPVEGGPAAAGGGEGPAPSGRSVPGLTQIANIVGVPGISVPCGFDEDGLPLGLQFVARAWDEQAAFDPALVFQKETDWHRRRPAFRA